MIWSMHKERLCRLGVHPSVATGLTSGQTPSTPRAHAPESLNATKAVTLKGVPMFGNRSAYSPRSSCAY